MRFPIALALLAAASASGASLRLYVTNSLADDITVIDLATFKVTGDLKVGQHVHGLCAPADGSRLFTTIESERNLKILDTASGRILATIPVTGRPNQCAATPDGRFVAVPIRDGNSVDVVDTRLQKVVKTLPIKVPHNAYNAGSNTDLFVSSMGSNQIDRINLHTMQYDAEVPTGGIPRPYAITPDEKTLYSALTDFHGFEISSIPERKVIGKVELPPAPPSTCELEPHTPTHGLALTPDGRQLWVTSLADGLVYVYDPATRKLQGKVVVGRCPNWIAFSPDGRYGAVSNSASNDASVIDVSTRRELARVKVGQGPKRLLVLSVK